MKFTVPVFLCFAAQVSVTSWGWMGIKSRPRPAPPQVAAVTPAQPLPDSLGQSRKVRSIPAGVHGTFLGNLEGVRCFNCAPDQVLLNLNDSAAGRSVILALRSEIWSALERPVKDKRVFDHGHGCFYFGYREKDSAFVGGAWTEVRIRNLPCYPYLKRLLQDRLTGEPGHPVLASPPPPVKEAAAETSASEGSGKDRIKPYQGSDSIRSAL